MQAQWEREDQEMEQLVREVQMHAEEERRREEQRRIGEQKRIAEEAEWQWRLVELQQVAEEVGRTTMTMTMKKMIDREQGQVPQRRENTKIR